MSLFESGGEGVYSMANGLFDFGATTKLMVKKFSGRAADVQSALTATIVEIQQKLVHLQEHGFHRDYQEVALGTFDLSFY